MSTTPPYSSYPDPYGSRYPSTRPALMLPGAPERRIGGVCAAIARTMEMNVTWLRVLVLLSVFLTSGVTLPLYILLWLVIPDEPRPAIAYRPYGAVGAHHDPAMGSASAYQPVRAWPEPQVPGANWGPAAHPAAAAAGYGPSRPAAHHVDPAADPGTYNPMTSIYADAERRIDEAVKERRVAGAGTPSVSHPSAGNGAPVATVVPLRPRPSDSLGERIL